MPMTAKVIQVSRHDRWDILHSVTLSSLSIRPDPEAPRELGGQPGSERSITVGGGLSSGPHTDASSHAPGSRARACHGGRGTAEPRRAHALDRVDPGRASHADTQPPSTSSRARAGQGWGQEAHAARLASVPPDPHPPLLSS